MVRLSLLLVLLVACERTPSSAPRIVVAPPEPETLRVELGSCTHADSAFSVGGGPPTRSYAVCTTRACLDSHWNGSLGLGTFGAIGHGSGTGPGRSPSYQAVAMGPLQPFGDDFTAVVRRYIRRMKGKMDYCYEKELLRTPGLGGTVMLELSIGATGAVTGTPTVVSNLDTTPVGTCIAEVLAAVQFPPPKHAPFEVRIPLTLNPGAKSTLRHVDPSIYDAPIRSVLASHVPALRACLRNEKAAYGSLLVNLEFDRSGAVSGTPVVTGAVDRACIATVAKAVRNTTRFTRMRCSMSFGTQPLAELPRIDIAADSMQLQGKPATELDVQAFAGDKRTRGTSEPLAVVGPIAIAAALTVPMARVRAIADIVNNEGIDVVFVVPHAFGGERVLGGALPPVPQPTFRRWPRPAHRVSLIEGDLRLDDKMVASWHELAAALAVTRAGSEPTIDIITDTETTFADYARLVDTAIAAGFTDWL